MTKLRVVERPEGEPVYPILSPDNRYGLEIGDMWREPAMDVEGRRQAWGIVLPNWTVWYTNSRSAGDGAYWSVIGTAPSLTVAPSINDTMPGNPWHGWIRDGEFFDA